MGGDDFIALPGMSGFSQYAMLPRVSPDAQAISSVDIDGDGKLDLCLVGAASVTLLRNDADAFNQFGFTLPAPVPGCRAGVWADYNSDGKPDLFLATPAGPKLYTNLGGTFRDDSAFLPTEACYNLTAAAWGDFDADGKPDVLLANGFHGLRLYRNVRAEPRKVVLPKVGDWHAIGIFRAANPADNFKTEFPVETEKFTPDKTYKGKRDMPTKWAAKDFKADPVQIPEVGMNCATYVRTELDMPAELQHVPLIRKPYGSSDLVAVLAGLWARRHALP